MKRFVIVILMCALLLTGCGMGEKAEQMEQYHNEVSGFFERLENYNQSFAALEQKFFVIKN